MGVAENPTVLLSASVRRNKCACKAKLHHENFLKNETQKFYSGGFCTGGCLGGFCQGVYVWGVSVLEPIFWILNWPVVVSQVLALLIKTISPQLQQVRTIKKHLHRKLQPALGVNFLLFSYRFTGHIYKKLNQPDHQHRVSYWQGLAVNYS